MTRTDLFVRWVLGVAAAIFIALGVAFMFAPSMMIDSIGLKAESKVAMADVRAVYGGLDLAIGILLVFCFFRKHWANGLAISVLACACLFSGRLVGIFLEPAQDALTFLLFASEVLGAVLSAVAWFLARRPESPGAPVPVAAPVATAPAPAPVAAAESPTVSQEG